MADTVTTTTAAGEADTIMTAAGWTRVGGAGLQAWGLDHGTGEFTLVTSDGDCDADPQEIIWTCGRYHIATTGVGAAAIQTCTAEPHHRNLAQTLAIVPSLKVADSVAEEPKTEPAKKASTPLSASDGNGVERQG